MVYPRHPNIHTLFDIFSDHQQTPGAFGFPTSHFSGATPESNNIWMIQLRKPQNCFWLTGFGGRYTGNSIDVFLDLYTSATKSYSFRVPIDLII